MLILNKIDRLFTELKLSPMDAYNQLRNVVVEVNALIGQLFNSDLFESSQLDDSNTNQAIDFEAVDDEGVYFQPEFGNVIFASASDKWAFSLEHFAKIYSARMNVDCTELKNSLWGDYYLETSSKQFKLGASNKGKTPMFVKIVMENIWTIYNTVINSDMEKLLKICSSLKLEVNEKRLQRNDNKTKIQTVLGKWLPLADGVLEAAVKYLPSPANLTEERVERLLSSQLGVKFESLPKKTKLLKKNFMACESSIDVPTIIFISKLFPVLSSSLSDSKRRPLHSEDDPQVFLAFARVFSGQVKSHQKIYLIEPKYIPGTNIDDSSKELPEFVKEIEIGDLFFLMGREVEKVDEIKAGNVFGISGKSQYFLFY